MDGKIYKLVNDSFQQGAKMVKTKIKVPKNVEKSLLNLYEVEWFRNFKEKNGPHTCDWAHIAVPDNTKKAWYVSVYKKGSYDFTQSNTLRLPTANQKNIIKSQKYMPQDASVICSFLSEDGLNNIITDVRDLYFEATRCKKGYGLFEGEKRIDDNKIVIIETKNFTLNFPVVYGNWTFAEGLENILKDHLNEIAKQGSKKFYKVYKAVQKEMKNIKGKDDDKYFIAKLVRMKDPESGKTGAELIADFALKD